MTLSTLAAPHQPAPAEIKSMIRPMSKRDDWVNWLYLAGDWFIICGAIVFYLAVPGLLSYVLAVIIIGSRMRALGNLLHEAAHFKLFAERRLNNLAGTLLCSWPIFVCYRRYVADHILHHRNLWRNDSDPDLALYAMTGTERSSRDTQAFSWFMVKHVILVIVPVLPLLRLAREAAGSRLRLAIVGGLMATAAVLAAAAPGVVVKVVVLCWIVPWFTSFQCITYWAELAEHGGLRDFGWNWGSRNWDGGWVTRWLIGSHSDDLYHLLHHWFPTVPHHRLRPLDAACRSVWPEYRNHQRCTGFFRSAGTGVSVMRDIWSGGTRFR